MMTPIMMPETPTGRGAEAEPLAALRRFVVDVAARDGETLPQLLASLTPGLGPRARLDVALDGCQALIALATDDPAALARAFGEATLEEQARDPRIRAGVAFAVALAHRLGFESSTPDDDARRVA